MKKPLEIWQPALVIWIVLIIFRGEILIKTVLAFPQFIPVIFTGIFSGKGAWLEAAGLVTECVVFFLLPVIVLTGRYRFFFFRSRIRFYNMAGLVFVYLFLFAGIITEKNPDFQKDLSVTKLLPPFSSVNVLHLKGETFGGKEKFLNKDPYDESIIFIDSMRFDGTWKYFQKHSATIIPADKIQFENNKPLITKTTFLLGSDALGRDVFSRLAYGARTSLAIGICASVISFLIGIITGFIAGYYEGISDMLLSRAVDVLLSFPIIILIILIVALFGNSFLALILTLGFTGWMGLFKIIKSELIVLKTKDYFVTSRLLGLSSMQLIIKDALPVFIIPALTNLVFQINNVIMAESSLSYLGLGVGNLYPSWGAMIQSGQEYITKAWWLLVFPGLMIILALQSIKGFGNRVNSYFYVGLMNDK